MKMTMILLIKDENENEDNVQMMQMLPAIGSWASAAEGGGQVYKLPQALFIISLMQMTLVTYLSGNDYVNVDDSIHDSDDDQK